MAISDTGLETSRSKTIAGARKQIQFVTLSPLEKGFGTGNHSLNIDTHLMAELYELLREGEERKIKEWLSTNLQSASKKIKQSSIPVLREYATRCNIKLLQNTTYDYFDELIRQYETHLALQKEADVQFVISEDDYSPSSKKSLVFIIEGIHSLGVCCNENANQSDVSVGKIKNRISQIKGEAPLEGHLSDRWQYPPFIMRLAGYFGNCIYGHARSFFDTSEHLFDQKKCLGKGVIKTAGFEIVRELLGLDEQLQPTGSRRILIDMHQLSALSREELYHTVFRKFNRNINPQKPIPVVFTDAAYSGIDYLAEMVRNSKNSVETEDFRINGFNGLGINMSDEDVLEVFRSNGMISLSLDESRMGSDFSGLEKLFVNQSKTRGVRSLMKQIGGIVSVPFAYHMPSPLVIWDCLNIGNGLQGSGITIDRYRTENNHPLIHEDLEQALTRLKKQEPFWFGGYTPQQLVDKIFHSNIKSFVEINY